MEPTHYYNGDFLKKSEIFISPNDVGFLRGYAVFEFFKVKKGVPIFWEDHLERLKMSANSIGLQLPFSMHELKEIIFKLIKINDFDYGSIKIILTGGDSKDGFSAGDQPTLLIQNNPFQDFDNSLYDNGASLMLHEHQRDFPQVKSTIYTNAVAQQKNWQSKGHLDVLYHQNGLVSEVSRSSVFFVKHGQIITNKDLVLPGVTQRNVIAAIKSEFDVIIREFKLTELLDADEVFITSTSKKVVPIIQIGEHKYGEERPGLVTKQVMTLFNKYLEDWVEARA